MDRNISDPDSHARACCSRPLGRLVSSGQHYNLITSVLHASWKRNSCTQWPHHRHYPNTFSMLMIASHWSFLGEIRVDGNVTITICVRSCQRFRESLQYRDYEHRCPDVTLYGLSSTPSSRSSYLRVLSTQGRLHSSCRKRHKVTPSEALMNHDCGAYPGKITTLVPTGLPVFCKPSPFSRSLDRPELAAFIIQEVVTGRQGSGVMKSMPSLNLMLQLPLYDKLRCLFRKIPISLAAGCDLY